MKALRSLALLVCLPLASLCAEPAPLLPVEAFFESSDISGLSISPTGRYFASLRPVGGRKQIVVVDLEKGTTTRLTDMKEENVLGVEWLKNDRLAFYMQVKGQESFGVYAVNADGTNLTIVRQATTVDANDRVQVLGGRASILHNLPDDPNEVIIGMVRGSSGLMDIYRANIHKENRRRIICQNPGKVRDWILDSKGVPRIGVAQDERATESYVLYRENEKTEWREIARFAQDQPSWTPLGFDSDDRTLFVSSNIGRATYAVYKYDLAARRLGEVVVEDPVYDVGGGLIRRGTDRKVIGVSYLADRERVVWLEPEMAKIQQGIDRALPDTLNIATSSTRDLSHVIVRAYSDRDPGTYYLLDTERMSLLELLRINSRVKPEQMASMQHIAYKARDGMRIYAYLTLPAGVEPRNLPLIVHPHGGPYGPRDEWGYNPDVQFLANRGYAVLQPNFRGSGGYGEAYESAGYKQWGLAMQDDLTDGVLHLVEQGIVDRNRVGIYGASYGGYAAMMAIIKEPALFRCAINYVGVTDIEILFEGFADYPLAAKESLARRFGHPVRDRAYMRANSPVRLVDRIRAPVLMAYGFFDPRVKLEHGERLHNLMKSKGLDVEYIVAENEGHGFGKQENAVRFARRVEAFLERTMSDQAAWGQIGESKVLEMPVGTPVSE